MYGPVYNLLLQGNEVGIRVLLFSPECKFQPLGSGSNRGGRVLEGYFPKGKDNMLESSSTAMMPNFLVMPSLIFH